MKAESYYAQQVEENAGAGHHNKPHGVDLADVYGNNINKTGTFLSKRTNGP